MLCYDIDSRNFRCSHWIWSWGPSILLLIEASKIHDLNMNHEKLKRVAKEIGDNSLRFQIQFKHHPANGLVVSRWRQGISNGQPHNYFISGSADAMFLAGWGWVPIYEMTGEKRYLEACKALAIAADRITHEFDLVPQDYIPYEGKWSDYTIDESGFGTEGFAEFYRITGDEMYQRIGGRYFEQCLNKFEREDGLWDRMWSFKTESRSPTSYHTRAAGWAMEGLLAAHRLLPTGRYLEKAKRMAEHLIKWQQSSGCWNYNFNKPVEEVGISEKGTALWSLLFYRLYNAAGDEQYLETARKALTWCLENQYIGPDIDAYGSIIGRSPQSGVSYRRWFDLSCVYTSAFFGLAVIEELKLLKSE